MGRTLHATTSGCDTAQFSNALSRAGFKLCTAPPITCSQVGASQAAGTTLQQGTQQLLQDNQAVPQYTLSCPSWTGQNSCSSQAGLLPVQRVQYLLNNLCPCADRLLWTFEIAGPAAAATLSTLPIHDQHTLQQLPPAFNHMPTYSQDLHTALSQIELAAARHATLWVHCAVALQLSMSTHCCYD